MIRVEVPATTANLGSGFDCLGLALDIYNIIEVEEINSGLEINITGDPLKLIPRDDSNLVYQAMMRVFEKVNYIPTGLRINQTNNIPVARGLGSSAACIAGGMWAANTLAGQILNQQELIHMAVDMEGHPDNVLPAIIGGMTISCKEQDRISYFKINVPSNISFAVMIPNFTLSTKQSREVLPDSVTREDAIFNISRACLFTASLLTGTTENLKIAVQDRLHQPYREKFIPHWDEIVNACYQLDASAVFLSGAGPSVIAVLNEDNICDADEYIQKIYGLLRLYDESWIVNKNYTCRDGIRVIKK